jgi:hypothetical protein
VYTFASAVIFVVVLLSLLRRFPLDGLPSFAEAIAEL